MPSLIRSLFTVLASSRHADLARQVQYLRVENQVLRSKLPKRLKVTRGERARLVRYGRPLGRAIMEIITVVKPGTFKRWLNGKPAAKTKPPGRGGRPRKPKEIRELVVRLAKATGWGYGRILGELRKLGVHSIFKPTIRTILREHGIDPAPSAASQPGTSS